MLNLSPLMLIVVCIICPMVLAYVGLILTRKWIPSHALSQGHDVTGPIFGTLGTIYGIFLAFIVATTWHYYSDASSNLVQEARCLQDLYSNVNASSPEFRDKIQKILRDYRDAVVNLEWKSLERGKANPEATKLLMELTNAYTQHKLTEPAEGVFFQLSAQNLNQMKSLRTSRIDDSASGLIPFLWCVLLIGGAATISFTFLFAHHNIHAQAIVTIILTGVISLTLYSIVNLDFPFSGIVALSPAPLQNLSLEPTHPVNK